MSRFPVLAETPEQRRERQRREDEALLLLLFLWSDDQLAYFDRNGRRVAQADVRKAVNAVVAATRMDVAELSRAVADGEIDVAEWQDGVARRLKGMHIAATAAGVGGFRQMNAAVTAEAESRITFHLTKLEGFAQDVANGFTTVRSHQIDSETGELQEVIRIVPVTSTRILQRADLYCEAGASDSYEGGRRDAAILAGFAFERNVLHPADHCPGCLGEDARGWVGIGELVPIGQRDCLVRCQCSMQFARELPDA